MVKINPVILIGGAGTRLWPMSRQNFPKQFNKFFGAHSLFQQTLLRLTDITPLEKIYLIVGENNYFICLDQLRELGVNNVEIIVEPVGKNTLPAIAVAAHHIQASQQNLMLVLPSDHLIRDNEKFLRTIDNSIQEAMHKLILFGVTPTEPVTGYGYIQTKMSETPPFKVEKFLEKPDCERAKVLIKQSNCYWNSGMFFFSTDTILREIEHHTPVINQLAKKALQNAVYQGNTCSLNKEAFASMPTVSVDIGIMEKTQNAYLYPLQSDWSDLGDWNSVCNSEILDADGNASVGQVVSLSTKNSYLRSSDKLLATIGVENLIVVASKDCVLVAEKNHAQSVKNLVDILKTTEFSEQTHNDAKVHRPWGSYESVVTMKNFQVKHIIVNPNGKLSLQMHHHRSEHWIVVNGIANVVCGDHAYQVHKNESTYIPKHTKHRLMNLQSTSLHLIEVQVGDYLSEDDIIRFDDVYGRTVNCVV